MVWIAVIQTLGKKRTCKMVSKERVLIERGCDGDEGDFCQRVLSC